jgi:hypothetical protein
VSEHVASTDPLARPSGACVTCPPLRGRAWTRADDRYVTCGHCYHRLRTVISEIAERYLKLDPRPGGQFESGSRGAPGFGSRPPLSLHVASMRDVRSSQSAKVWVARDGRVHSEEERPPLSVHGTLSTLCWDVAEHRGVSGPGDRDNEFTLLTYLDKHLDHITRVTELAVEVDIGLRNLVSALRPLTGDRRRRIGKCPRPAPARVQDPSCRCGHTSTQHDNDATQRRCNEPHCGCQVFIPQGGNPEETAEERCGAVLYAPADADEVQDVISCRACGHDWVMSEWLTLGDEALPVTSDHEW